MKTEYCADAVAMYEGKLVLVKRLTFPKGLALPGGRRKIIKGRPEGVEDCAIREFEEETGLALLIDGTLGLYNHPDRDPRGRKISTVVYGKAFGEFRDESKKTKVIFVDLSQVESKKDQFAFDHYAIINDYKSKIYIPIHDLQ